MPKRPDQVNVRISDLGKNIMSALQDHYGISQAAVVEMLLRDKAREVGMLGPGGVMLPQFAKAAALHDAANARK
jgi:antitoxin component of RelBE/YafQ-DinJ toxin-antitoxin module